MARAILARIQEVRMGFFRRLWGLIIIIRALFPILFVIAVVLIARQMVVEVRLAMAAPVARVNASIDRMQSTVTSAQEAAEDLNAGVSAMVESANAINERIELELGQVTEAVGVKPLTLADKLFDLLGLKLSPSLITRSVNLEKTLDILGLSQVKGVFAQIANLFRDVARITGVTAIARDVNAIIQEFQAAARLLLEIVGKWARIMTILALTAIGLLFISYLEHLVRSLRRGWALLRGLPDPWR
ncbi:MAG: hypothetical protein JXA74_08190 [Anaerolineae bacterium]|nr:hypothetical protein [Anaerolineae bacterium]